MTNEEKQLLLIDLCARLPHGVIILDIASKHYGKFIRIDIPSLTCYYDGAEDEECQTICNIKPILRPMSSMTPEEQIEYEKRVKVIQDIDRTLHWCDTPDSIEWLQKNHFDYHHMIEKGLALAALEGMYN